MFLWGIGAGYDGGFWQMKGFPVKGIRSIVEIIFDWSFKNGEMHAMSFSKREEKMFSYTYFYL